MSKFLSIICASFNSGKTIQNLLESVRNQTCKDFELIIVDGNSTDNTMDILKKNRSLITKIISENDEGIYDAWNKGIDNCRYQWISFVGADDILHEDYVSTYKDALNKIGDREIHYISSKVNYLSEKGTLIKILGKKWVWNEFKVKMTTAHVGSLHSKKLFEDIGLFDTTYKIIGDYELLLRKGVNLSTFFIDHVTLGMQAGGRSLSYKALIERYRAHRNTVGFSKFKSTLMFFIGVATLIRFRLIHKV